VLLLAGSVSGWELVLSLSAAVGYGALGGLVTEALFFWQQLRAWQQARHQAASGKKPRPTFASFVDPLPDGLVAVTRAALGCAAGWLLRSELSGTYAALIVGASAPALLASLGKATSMAGVLGEAERGGPIAPASPVVAGTGDSWPEAGA
jgi:hypothetical protein